MIIAILAIMALIITLLTAYIISLRRKSKGAKQTFDLLKNICEAVPQSMILIDKNKHFIEIYSIDSLTLDTLEHKDILGKHIDAFAKDPDSLFQNAADMLSQACDKLMSSPEELKYTYRYTVLDFHFEAMVSRLPNNMILSQVRDITTIIHNSEEKERKNHEELSMALSAGALSTWKYNVNSKVISSLQTDNPIIGASIHIDDLLEKIVPADREKASTIFTKIITKKEVYQQIQIWMHNVKGDKMLCSAQAIPHEYDGNGNVITVIGSAKDITNEYLTTKAIADNKAKLKMAVHWGGMTQWEYRTENRSFTFYYGSRSDHSYAISAQQLRELLHPDDISILDSAYHMLLSGEKQSTDIECRIKQNNNYSHFKTNAVVFEYDENGKASHIIGLAINITDQVKMTQDLIALRSKAEESNRLKTAFIANMSHEIRTPLNAILGFSELILTTEDKNDCFEYIKIVKDNNELLLSLISDILDLSSIESGQITLSYKDVNVDEILSMISQSLELKVKPGVEVIIDQGSHGLIISADQTRLSQVITNFTNNASKFTFSGSITLGYSFDDTTARIYVRDTGKGIAADSLDTVFQRFVKLDPYIQGTGLGLSICESIIERMDGRIGATSTLGLGSEFWLEVPIKRV